MGFGRAVARKLADAHTRGAFLGDGRPSQQPTPRKVETKSSWEKEWHAMVKGCDAGGGAVRLMLKGGDC